MVPLSVIRYPLSVLCHRRPGPGTVSRSRRALRTACLTPPRVATARTTFLFLSFCLGIKASCFMPKDITKRRPRRKRPALQFDQDRAVANGTRFFKTRRRSPGLASFRSCGRHSQETRSRFSSYTIQRARIAGQCSLKTFHICLKHFPTRPRSDHGPQVNAHRITAEPRRRVSSARSRPQALLRPSIGPAP